MTKDNNKTPELSPLYNILMHVEEAIHGVSYKYTKEEDYLKITSLQESQLVYWSEIIQRVHICGSTSILRLKKWYDASIAAYVAENYYGFCASLRGLIESCADTFYTTSKIMEPIATEFNLINTALKGAALKVLLSEEIENELIHYMFAMKLGKADKEARPESHYAKHVRTYMDAIKNDAVDKLYSELCEVSHPSQVSLVPFLFSEDEYSLILHRGKIDKQLNDHILKRHKKAILKASEMAVIPAMCLLKLINHFDAPITEAVRIKEDALLPIADCPLWKHLHQKIEKSKNG
jgi:hypothetical protein